MSARESTMAPSPGATMPAFLLDRYAKGATLRRADVPVPEVGEHDVLVRIHAAGVNVLDAKLRSGEFKLILPYRLPLVLGHDLAGTVVRVGAAVTAFRPGDAVYARPADHRIGTFAHYIAVHQDDVAPKPATLSMTEAAALPLVALTAWQALVERAGLQRGQKVFIQAGSGGVGSFAIQLARHLGATVATTASAANADWLKSLGADIVIDYRREDFSAVLSDYDVVLHSQDAATLAKSLGVLKPGGKLVSISGPPDTAFARAIGASWPVRQVTRLLSLGTRRRAARLGVDYSFLFMHASGSQLRQIGSLVDAGILRPVVERVYPFDETNAALAHVEAGHARGKVVIGMDGGT